VLFYKEIKALTIGSTLAQCKSVAALFRNTCTTAPETPANWDSSFTS